MERKEWYVLLDRSGHHRTVSESHRPNRGERFVDFVSRTYREASRFADDLNTVSEVLSI